MAADADRVAASRFQRRDLFDPHVVLPAIGEVILIEEALADSEAKIGEMHAVRVIAEADAAETDDAVCPPVDDEAVQVLIRPAQHKLEGGLQVGDRGVAPDEDAAPDQRTDAAQDDAEVVDRGG